MQKKEQQRKQRIGIKTCLKLRENAQRKTTAMSIQIADIWIVDIIKSTQKCGNSNNLFFKLNFSSKKIKIKENPYIIVNFGLNTGVNFL